MSTVSASDPSPAAWSLPQHKAALWSDDQQQVDAVVMGSRVPELPARLAAADLVNFHCLIPGALTPPEQRSAPYLARLKRESEFTDWLLFEAAAGLGDWGVLACSSATLLVLRSHLRSLRSAQLPAGQTIQLEWMDAPILTALLPLFDGAALASFMGPVQTFVMPGLSAWTSASVELGRLNLRSIPVAKAG